MAMSSLVKIIFSILLFVGIYLLFTNKISGRARIVLIVFILVIGVFLFSQLSVFRTYDDLQESPVNAKQTYEISGSTLRKNSGSYTISTWIYIDDWNHNYGNKKVVIQNYIDGKNINPVIYLDEYKNDIHFEVGVLNGNSTGLKVEKLTVSNVSLQKWVNIIMTINDRTMDVYVNGKLVRSKGMSNIIDSSSFNNGLIQMTPDGGFGGFISSFRYYNEFITPQKAWSIYRSGLGSMASNFLDRYNLKLSFYEDNVMKNEYNII
jgi:hypothetical protein